MYNMVLVQILYQTHMHTHIRLRPICPHLYVVIRLHKSNCKIPVGANYGCSSNTILGEYDSTVCVVIRYTKPSIECYSVFHCMNSNSSNTDFLLFQSL